MRVFIKHTGKTNILLVLTIIFSCESPPIEYSSNLDTNRQNTSSLSLHDSEIYLEKDLKIENLIEEITYIPIKTSEKGLLGKVRKVITDKNKLVLIDENIAKRVLMIDFEGNIIKDLNTIGRGPGEFLRPRDASFSPDSKQIVLYARDLSKLIFYTSNGDYLDETHLNGFYTNDIAWLENDVFAMGNRNTIQEPRLCFNLMIYSLQNDFIGRSFPFDPERGRGKMNYGSGSTFFKSENYLLFSPIQSDTIFEIKSKDEILQKYVVDFGKNSVPESFYKSSLLPDELTSDLRNSSYSYNVNNIYETKEWLFFNYVYQGRFIKVLYNKVIKKLFAGAEFSPSALGLRLGSISSTFEGKFVTIIYPEWIDSFRNLPNEDKFKTLKEEFNKLPDSIKDVKINDNPIIALIKLKTFIK